MTRVTTTVHLSDTDQNKYEQVLQHARQVLAGYRHRSESERKRQIRQAQHRLTEDETRQIGEQYLAGATTYQLAEQWHINRETVGLALKRAGVDTRHGKLTPQQLAEAHDLQAQGWSLNQLGKKYGVDPKTMKHRLQSIAT